SPVLIGAANAVKRESRELDHRNPTEFFQRILARIPGAAAADRSSRAFDGPGPTGSMFGPRGIPEMTPEGPEFPHLPAQPGNADFNHLHSILFAFERMVDGRTSAHFELLARSIRLSEAGRHSATVDLKSSGISDDHPLNVLTSAALFILESIERNGFCDPKALAELDAAIKLYNERFGADYGKFSVPWLFSFAISGLVRPEFANNLRVNAQQFARLPEPMRSRTIAFHLLQLTFHRPRL